jgi:hypothetical protein
MRSVAAIVALVVLTLGPGGAAPSAAAPLGKGALEIGPSLAFSHNSYSDVSQSIFFTSLSTSTLDATGFVGYFVTDMVELGGSARVTYQSYDYGFGSSSSTVAGLTGGITLNFISSGSIVPLLRGSLGVSWGGPENMLIPSLEGGLRAMVGRSASVNFLVGYQHQTIPFSDVGDRSVNSVTFGVGVSVFPKTGQ